MKIGSCSRLPPLQRGLQSRKPKGTPQARWHSTSLASLPNPFSGTVVARSWTSRSQAVKHSLHMHTIRCPSQQACSQHNVHDAIISMSKKIKCSWILSHDYPTSWAQHDTALQIWFTSQWCKRDVSHHWLSNLLSFLPCSYAQQRYCISEILAQDMLIDWRCQQNPYCIGFRHGMKSSWQVVSLWYLPTCSKMPCNAVIAFLQTKFHNSLAKIKKSHLSQLDMQKDSGDPCQHTKQCGQIEGSEP